MFEEAEEQRFSGKGEGRQGSKERTAPFNWRSLPIEVLIQYRDEITAVLPPLTLKDTNLEEEMILQFHALRALQNEVLQDDDVPANQKSQVANSVGSVMKALADKQESIYSSERFKRIENLLIRTLKKLPDDVAAEFLDHYEKILRAD